MWGDRSPALVGRPEAAQMHDLVVVDQAQGHTGNVIGLHLCADIRINAGNIGSPSLWCCRYRKNRKRQRQQRQQAGQDTTENGSGEIRFHICFLLCHLLAAYCILHHEQERGDRLAPPVV